MNVLLDHCVNARIRRLLKGHLVRTASEMGWAKLQNGVLLSMAATRFDVMITTDRNQKHQLNLSKLPLAVIVLLPRGDALSDIAPLIPQVNEALNKLVPCSFVEIAAPPP